MSRLKFLKKAADNVVDLFGDSPKNIKPSKSTVAKKRAEDNRKILEKLKTEKAPGSKETYIEDGELKTNLNSKDFFKKLDEASELEKPSKWEAWNDIMHAEFEDIGLTPGKMDLASIQKLYNKDRGRVEAAIHNTMMGAKKYGESSEAFDFLMNYLKKNAPEAKDDKVVSLLGRVKKTYPKDIDTAVKTSLNEGKTVTLTVNDLLKKGHDYNSIMNAVAKYKKSPSVFDTPYKPAPEDMKYDIELLSKRKKTKLEATKKLLQRGYDYDVVMEAVNKYWKQ